MPHTLAAPAHSELIIKKSRFIGCVQPMPDRASAQAHVDALWKEHPGAAHICWALLAGGQSAAVDVERKVTDRSTRRTPAKPGTPNLLGSRGPSRNGPGLLGPNSYASGGPPASPGGVLALHCNTGLVLLRVADARCVLLPDRGVLLRIAWIGDDRLLLVRQTPDAAHHRIEVHDITAALETWPAYTGDPPRRPRRTAAPSPHVV